jgi:hypothetical protein
MTKGLDEILSGDEPAQAAEPIVEAPTPEPSSETTEAPAAKPDETGRLHAPDGKFAPKEAKPPAEPDPTAPPSADKPAGGMVPQQALHATREKEKEARAEAEQLRREIAELRGMVTARPTPATPPPVEQPKRVEFWEDPNKFIEQALSPVQDELINTRVELSHTRAVSQFGADAVAAAETAMREAIQRGELDGQQIGVSLKRARDPVGEVVRWHQNTPSVRDAKLREQIRAEVLAELGTQQPAVPSLQAPAVDPSVMPSNLAGARNVGSRSGPAWSGPAPINDIFDRSRAKAG